MRDFPNVVGNNPGRYGNGVGQTKRVCLACRAKEVTKECSRCNALKQVGEFLSDVDKNPGRYGIEDG